MRVKICGITRPEDARLAAELGAWAVGFVFAPSSPRYVAPDRAAEIARGLEPSILRVGVFVDETRAEIDRIREQVGLDYVQLHGRETREFAAALGAKVIKAVRDPSLEEIRALRGYPAEIFLFDGPRSGEVASWERARELKSIGPVILAGGLGPDNVTAAVEAVAPWAVDLSSRLESQPGVKAASKLREFFQVSSRLGRGSSQDRK